MISVIISFYKVLDNLELVLSALEQQSFNHFEAVVAEDDDAPQTKDFLQEARKKYRFPILHCSQEDKGFRKCKILNEAIRATTGDKIVFLDCDCIPHKHLLKNYDKTITEGVFLTGRRVMLSEKMTQKLKQSKDLNLLSFGNCLLYGVDGHLKRALYAPCIKERSINKRGLLGCNMGGSKRDLLAVNGFDEDYQLPAVGEDSDIDWRFRASGVLVKTVFYSCLTYHLYHKKIHDGNSQEQIDNRAMMSAKEKAGDWFCKNGIKKQIV
jgi:glycosyltransferase involved in cell wall biosynthesis